MSVQKRGSKGSTGGSGRTPTWKHWAEDPRKVRLMEWLTTPPSERNPTTRADLAVELGVALRTLQLWMTQADFRDDWKRQADRVIGDPDRHQNVLDTLYQAAIDPGNRSQVQAAKLYLEATRAIQPATTRLEVVKPKDLSDAELDEMLADGAAALAAERRLAEVEAEAVPEPAAPTAWPAPSSPRLG